MKTMSSEFAAHLAGGVTRLATCWKIVRRDGVRYHFTDYDKDLTFEGSLYKAQAGYSRTAISSDASMSVDNLDVSGVFDSSDIREEDLRAGLFDGAEVFVFLVNWSDLSMGQISLRRGWFGEISLSENGIFETELRGMTQALSKKIGGLYTPECRADLGDNACKINLEPPEVCRNMHYQPGDLVRVRTSVEQAVWKLPLINANFASEGTRNSSPSGWVKISGDWAMWEASSVSDLPPYSGTSYLIGGTSNYGELTQTVDLLPTLDAARIDALAYEIDVSIVRGNGFANDMGRVLVEFLDNADLTIATLMDTGFEDIVPVGSWVVRQALNVPVISLARKVKVSLFHQLVDGSWSNSAFDKLTLIVRDMTLELNSSADFEDRVYRCSSTGITAASAPIYNVTVGVETSDGKAVFIAEEAWARAGEVISVMGVRQVTVSVSDPRANLNWFAGGLLIWETGANRGLSSEVKSHDPVGGDLTFYLPQPFEPEIGDRFRISPGCDKRFVTCRDRFANVLNFRGEPYLPGQDELMRYPDAK